MNGTEESFLSPSSLATSMTANDPLYDPMYTKKLFITVDDKRVHSAVMKEQEQNGIFANISLPIMRGNEWQSDFLTQNNV